MIGLRTCSTCLRCLIAWVLLMNFIGNLGAQTNPVAQPLPYSQNFGTAGFTSLPAGVGAWNGLNGGSVNSAASAAATAPTGDATLTNAATVQTTGAN